MLRRMIFGVTLLGLFSPVALAFQETKGGSTTPADAAPKPSAQQPLDLGTSEEKLTKPGGTEIRIPGLGKLGVLPKLDFGLELLYGVAEEKRLEEEKGRQDPTDEGVQIRGTLKHRF
jgi:hypothetical protein